MANEVVINVKANDQASANLKEIGNKASGLGGVFKTAAGTALGFTAALGGIGAVKGGFNLLIGGAMEAQQVMAQTEAVLKSTGGAAGITVDEVTKLAGSLQKITPFSDEAVQSAENLLLTFTSIGKDVFPEATKTVLDMSTALGQDTKESAIQLGKALQDPILGVTALRRVGVNFNDAQQEMIKGLVESGDLLGAQKLILGELSKEFGGSAEAAGKTFGGQLTILRNRISDVFEGLGLKLLPKLQEFGSFVQAKVVPAVEDMAAAIQTKVIPALREFWDKHGQEIIAFAKDAAQWLKELGQEALNLGEKVGNFLAPALDTLADLWDNLQPVLENHVLPALREVGDWMTEHKPVIIGLAAAIVLLVAPWLAVAAAVAVVLAKWDEISQMFTVTIPKAIDTVIEKVTGFPVIGEIISGVFESIRIITETTWNLVKTHIETTINVIKDIITIVMALIKGDWEGAWNGIKQLVADVWDGIKTQIETILGGIQALIANYLQTYLGIFGDIWMLIKDTVIIKLDELTQGVRDKLLNLGIEMFNLGQFLVDSMRRGMEAVIDKLLDVARNIRDKAKEILDPRNWFSTPEEHYRPLWRAAFESIEEEGNRALPGISAMIQRMLQAVAMGDPNAPALADIIKAQLPRPAAPGPAYTLTPYAVSQARQLIAAGSPNAPSQESVLAGIPRLAHGGKVTRPTLAVVGDAGPEAVVPLNQGGWGNSVININISAIDGASVRRIMPQIITELQRAQRGALA